MKGDILLLFALFASVIVSCEHKDYPNLIVAEEDLIVLDTIWKINNTLDNSCKYKNEVFSGQGMAILNDTLYRLFHSGVCIASDISGLEAPKTLFTTELGSRIESNHCNCAQFDYPSLGEGLLYVSSVKELNGERGECYVERVCGEKAELIQTISIENVGILDNYKGVNIICGDDGLLWIFGYNIQGTKIIVAKARKPSISEGFKVLLTDSDIIDYWFDSDLSYKISVSQGGTIHNGYLYFVFGSRTGYKHIVVYNTATHQKVGNIELNDCVYEEPEDCCFKGDTLLVSIYGGKGYYALLLKQ